MHRGDRSIFEKRADLNDIYPGNVLWMVTAGKVRKVEILSGLLLEKSSKDSIVNPDNWLYRFFYCYMNNHGGINSTYSCAKDYGLGKDSSGGNCLFHNQDDAYDYTESINKRHSCTYCGRDI